MVKLTYKCDLCGKDIVTLTGFNETPFGKGYYTVDIYTDEHKFTEHEICGECLEKIMGFMNGLTAESGDD